MGVPSIVACVLAVCLPAICQGQQYWGGYGWRPVRQPLVNVACERAYPVDEAATVRTTCRYPCQGWPVRYANEQDGTPCQLSWWQQGVCFRGRCQRQSMVPSVPSVPRDEENNVEARPNLVPRLVCRNRQHRLKFPAVVRSCQFVCKQRRNAFLANEDNGTPCLVWGGQVGYCDQGVCKAVEATAAPTTAQATSTVISTTTQLPGASSADSDASGVTAAATEEDVTVAQSAGPTTAATTPAPMPAVPAVRPQWRPGFVGVKCDRAYPARVSNGRVAKCRFLCGGYPTLGISFEEDGTPCWRKKTLQGVCFDGKCKAVPPPTEATTMQGESSTTYPSAAQTDAFGTTGADESSAQSTTGAEDAETLSTSTTSGVQEDDDANTNQGVTAQGAESTTAKSELVTSEQQAGPEEQLTTADSSPSEDEGTHTEDNVSEAARPATTVESGTTDSTGNVVVEVTTTLEQTTVESVPESTAVQTETTDLAGSGQDGTPSADEVTAPNEVEGDGEQVSTVAGPAAGEDEEEGSGNTDKQTDSSVSSQEATTSSTGVEEVVAVVSETDAVVVDASTQSATEGTADGDAKSETDEPQTSQASVTTAGLDASTDAGAHEQGGASFTEAEHDAQSTASAVTEGLQEDTETQSADKDVVVVVTVSSLENPTTPAQEEAGDHAASTPAADLVPATTTSEDVSVVEQEVTEDVSFATTERALQATTASVESETVKVITTVTRKEIVRPVGADDLSEATLVDRTRTTSVETLPVSKLNDTVKPTREQFDVSVSSDNPSVAADETIVGSQDSSSDGALVNELEAGAMTASTAVEADQELAVTEQPEAKAVTVSHENGERTTVADESATVKIVTTITEKEVTRPTDEEADQSGGTSVDMTQTTSVETLPLSEVEDKVASSEEESAVSDTTTGAEEVLQPEQGATEVSTSAVVDEALESTTAAAAAESATVKVITTVTHKEIVRPVDSDDSQSDATVVDTSKTTSVETLPFSEVGKSSTSSTEESAVAESTTVSEEVFKTVQDATEVSSVAVASESPESTTSAAAADPATVKVITTVTHKEVARPVDSDDSQSDATVVDTSKMTSVETLPQSEVEKSSPSSAEESAAAESTTVSEEVFQTMHNAVEVSSIAVADESSESTTTAASAEPATVKVITTVTRKEIVRPVGSDDSQSDATVVDASKTTSVETLSASEYQNADDSNTAQSEVVSSSENSVSVNDETAANDAVSSGPSIVITDFVQKTASSSKEPTTAPTIHEEDTDSP